MIKMFTTQSNPYKIQATWKASSIIHNMCRSSNGTSHDCANRLSFASTCKRKCVHGITSVTTGACGSYSWDEVFIILQVSGLDLAEASHFVTEKAIPFKL